jgi:hypothetical protein
MTCCCTAPSHSRRGVGYKVTMFFFVHSILRFPFKRMPWFFSLLQKEKSPDSMPYIAIAAGVVRSTKYGCLVQQN